MRQILMPTDFSENAKNAISYALELFKYERSSFYFLHAYQDAIYNNPKLTRTNLEVVTKSVEDFVANKLEETLAFVERSCRLIHDIHIRFWQLIIHL